MDDVPFNLTPAGDWIVTTSNLANYDVSCPLCTNIVSFFDFSEHLYEHHTMVYHVWTQLLTSPLLVDPWDASSTWNTEGVRDVDSMTYDQLLELCNTIGYHNPGLTKEEKDEVLEEIEITQFHIEACPRCAICLTDFADIINVNDRESQDTTSMIARCGHLFCTSCIDRWLDTNKTCPLCSQEVQKCK